MWNGTKLSMSQCHHQPKKLLLLLCPSLSLPQVSLLRRALPLHFETVGPFNLFPCMHIIDLGFEVLGWPLIEKRGFERSIRELRCLFVRVKWDMGLSV